MVVEPRLTQFEIDRDKEFEERLQASFPDYSFTFKGTEIDEIPVPYHLVEHSEIFREYVTNMRKYLLKGRFIYCPQIEDWEKLQRDINDDNDLFMWHTEVSLLRSGALVGGLFAPIDLFQKRTKKILSIAEYNFSYEYSTTVENIFKSVNVEDVNLEFFTLEERTYYANELLGIHYGILSSLKNLESL